MADRQHVTTTTAAALLGVTLDEAKSALRVDEDDVRDDAAIALKIREAMAEIARSMGWVTTTTTFSVYRDAFPAGSAPILIPRYPVQSIGFVKYLDDDGVETTLAGSAYRVDTVSRPGRITPAFGTTWPSSRSVTNAVWYEVVAGGGDEPSDVDVEIRGLILDLLVDWYDAPGARRGGELNWPAHAENRRQNLRLIL